MEVIFLPVVQCHVGCAKLHKKCLTERKSLTKCPTSPEVQGCCHPWPSPWGCIGSTGPWLTFLDEAENSSTENFVERSFQGWQGKPCGSRVPGRRIWMLVFWLSLYFWLCFASFTFSESRRWAGEEWVVLSPPGKGFPVPLLALTVVGWVRAGGRSLGWLAAGRAPTASSTFLSACSAQGDTRNGFSTKSMGLDSVTNLWLIKIGLVMLQHCAACARYLQGVQKMCACFVCPLSVRGTESSRK